MSAAKLHLRPALLGCLGLLLAAPAHAQTPMPTTPTTGIAATDFQIRVMLPKGKDFVFVTADVDRDLYLNRAHCECDSPIRIRVELTPQALATKKAAITKQRVSLILGTAACVDATSSVRTGAKCTTLRDKIDLINLTRQAEDVDTTVGALFRAANAPTGEGCAADFMQAAWLLVDETGTGDPVTGLQGTSAPTLPLPLDGRAPPPPSDVQVTPGNEALAVSWTRTMLASDQNGYVVFCSRAGLPVFKDTFFHGKDFFTQQLVCGTSTTGITQKLTAADPVLAADNLEADTGRPIDAPAEMQRLDTAYVCSNLLTTSTEWRIHTLQNGIQYVVGVASVDTHGNASPLDLALVQTPIPTTDFYRAYRAAGGGADGGFCSYGQRPRAAGWWLSLLAVAALAVSRRRR
jgi:hypothetical protein